MCVRCSGTKRASSCVPLWSITAKAPGIRIRCGHCAKNKHGCSFSTRDWSILAWPRIVKTSAGDIRRREEREAKEASDLKLGRRRTLAAPAMAKSVSEDSGVGRVVRKRVPPSRFREDSPPPSQVVKTREIVTTTDFLDDRELSGLRSRTPESITGPPGTQGSSIAGPSGTQGSSMRLGAGFTSQFGASSHRQGRVEEVFFEDLSAYESALCQGASSLEVGSAIANAQAARRRERDACNMIQELVLGRTELYSQLLSRLHARARSLSQQERIRDEEEE